MWTERANDLLRRNHHDLRSDETDVLGARSLMNVLRVEVLDGKKQTAVAAPVDAPNFGSAAIVKEVLGIERDWTGHPAG
jgi:hypothetical protein